LYKNYTTSVLEIFITLLIKGGEMEGGRKNVEPLFMVVVLLVLSILWINGVKKGPQKNNSQVTKLSEQPQRTPRLGF
jgi:hypothetical protein